EKLFADAPLRARLSERGRKLFDGRGCFRVIDALLDASERRKSMKQSFEIFGKRVGAGARCFVIAEAGSNHNGSRELALRLIDTAADAGADAVKFQTFEAKRLYPRSAGKSDYLHDETPIFDIIKAMEMPIEWLPALRDHAHERGLAFISSPFHEEAVELLNPFVDAFKIASYEITHEPLLRAVAARKKPVILSTGAATIAETEAAVSALKNAGCDELIVLQCTASYPTPPEAANVRALVTLRDALGVPTGLSDHTRDPCVAPMVAAALGAAAVEKHFTLSNRLPGPDHAFAVEPSELALLVRRVRDVETVGGSGLKDVQTVEEELRSFARRSIFTTRPVLRGERFTRDNVDVLRQGKLDGGLPPSELERVLGSVAARDVSAEIALLDADLSPAEPSP
ncbi:MAG TPA: N-acetylneuraminate synthase family protein, partial [Polyangiaceae bacterium]|nr:N-acetylneuraminate synthase family protein [Polyangiaceae bacterium]